MFFTRAEIQLTGKKNCTISFEITIIFNEFFCLNSLGYNKNKL